MKVYNVTMSDWDEVQGDYVEYQKQVIAEDEYEACETAEEEHPGTAHYAVEVEGVEEVQR